MRSRMWARCRTRPEYSSSRHSHVPSSSLVTRFIVRYACPSLDKFQWRRSLALESCELTERREEKRVSEWRGRGREKKMEKGREYTARQMRRQGIVTRRKICISGNNETRMDGWPNNNNYCDCCLVIVCHCRFLLNDGERERETKSTSSLCG